ncbi:MAG: hypothetical protein BYD32DRAFT_25630 [Podila humilis]|nr:MAG: hypothetical protein BYD32DRAFT_25630 [Podila humilis]
MLAIASILHIYFAVNLLVRPTSFYYLTNTFLGVNAFVWSRIFYGVYRHLGLFKDDQYSVSMLTGALLLSHSMLSLPGIMLIMVIAAVPEMSLRHLSLPNFWSL